MSAMALLEPARAVQRANQVGDLAADALLLELGTWPKPGLVSHVDSGSHADMNAEHFHASAEALRPFFARLFEAGAAGAEMGQLRAIGRTAEQAMLEATGGVNTHRGAIFGLGLLCAAAGAAQQPQAVSSDCRATAAAARGDVPPGNRDGHPTTRNIPPIISPDDLGAFVRQRWGADILAGPRPSRSHGVLALQRYGAGGARAEAAAGFPDVYRVGLPALRTGSRLSGGKANAARVQTCFALIAQVDDTNLLHRSGLTGLRFARQAARGFLERGGVGCDEWEQHAIKIHQDFVARRLSPGGSADLLAVTLLVSAL